MRDLARALAIVFILSAVVSATTVSVHTEKETYGVDEPVVIQLIIDPTKPVGGQLILYRISDGKYALARLLYTKPTPEQCLVCSRDWPLSEYLNRTFLYQPDSEGDYVIEANFAGIQVSRNFTVGSTSTSSTTSSSSSTTTSTSSTSTTTVKLSSSSTTLVLDSTTTAKSEEAVPRGNSPYRLLYVAAAASLLLYAVFLVRRDFRQA